MQLPLRKILLGSAMLLGCLIGFISFPLMAATFNVNSSRDFPDLNPGNGVCNANASGSRCTLRAAIQESNANPGIDTIQLQPITYSFTRTGANEEAAATGDLDITQSVVINGSGATISAVGIDRVFDIHPVPYTYFQTNVNCSVPHVDVTMVNLIITNGNLMTPGPIIGYNTSMNGGGINYYGCPNDRTGTLILQQVIITNNQALPSANNSQGGGIRLANGSLVLSKSTVSNNLSADGGGIKLGSNTIFFSYSDSEISNSSITGNSAVAVSSGSGGGIALSPTGSEIIEIFDTTIGDNTAFSGGGGLVVDESLSGPNVPNIFLTNVTITGNKTITPSGGTGGGGISVGSGFSYNGLVSIENSIIAENEVADPTVAVMTDCFITPSTGPSHAVSLGHNLLSISCPSLTLQSTDLSGTLASPLDPKLDVFTNNGVAGDGHFPLLQVSPAINAANSTTCNPEDQIGEPRNFTCDIGSVEYW